MDKNKHPGQEDSVYRTGSTRPPKNYGGIIAVLLVVVIFLCGINGVLSLMNIRLFRQLQESPEPTLSAGVAFSEGQESAAPSAADACIQLPFGLQGCTLSGFDQMLYRLPQGVYITFVTPEGTADCMGIRPGDVLVQLCGESLTDAQALTDILGRLQSGQTVSAEFNRDGETFSLELTVD